MALEMRQSLKITQNLLMTPQLQQAIKLLQLSRLELEQFVSQQLSENPALEENYSESVEESIQTERERESTTEDFVSNQVQEASSIVDSTGDKVDKESVDWEALSRLKEAAQQTTSKKKSTGEEAPNYENFLSSESTLNDVLSEQLGELDLSEEEKNIAALIVGNINSKGYLDISVEELSEAEDLSKEAIEDMLDTIQRMEPAGIAARDLKECLLNQLREFSLKNGIVEKIVEHHMTELETRNYQAIAKGLGLTLDEVIKNVALIADLDPIPARQYGGETAQTIIPDVYIFKLGDKWVVSLNEDGLPRLKVSELYNDDEIKKFKKDDKEYVKDKVRSATWLIKSIQQRQKTIFRVAECILERQIEFFEKGTQFLKPMILKDIAEDLEMHESTISRVTNKKYVHTPRGVFELKYFFNSSIGKVGGGEMASAGVKELIKNIVSKEDTKKPFSDQKIVEFLENKGIKLARRTVAKYREQLGILPSSKRKKYF